MSWNILLQHLKAIANAVQSAAGACPIAGFLRAKKDVPVKDASGHLLRRDLVRVTTVKAGQFSNSILAIGSGL